MNVLGTIVSSEEGPSTGAFAFVVAPNARVRKGAFVQVKAGSGRIVGSVQEILRSNRYFERPESVSEYGKGSSGISSAFPVGEWEYSVASCVVNGFFSESLERCFVPPSPGAQVEEADDTLLSQVTGFDENGLEIGKMLQHSLPARVSPTRLLQKHLAVLGMSGCGKSNLSAVILEELILRPKERGRLAAVAFDAHGDYIGFADLRNKEFASKTRIIEGSEMRIAASSLSPALLRELMPDVTRTAARDFAKVVNALKKEGEAFGLAELIEAVQSTDSLKDSVRQPLLSWLDELSELDLFGKTDYPAMQGLVEPGKLAVFDLSSVSSLRKKQALVSFFGRKLFNLRRDGKIPPYVMLVEEAHNFAPEKTAKGGAVSKTIIETLAREGRKFGACLCLVSQRPVHLSTTALSQCNSFIVMRVTNPYDLNHIAESCESIDKSSQDQITSLGVGEALLLGEAVNFPLFTCVRVRKTSKAGRGTPLEQMAKEYEDSLTAKQDGDAKAFV
ncbi:TPA: ATP-binding protein [Candidatus Micrarchaeota archaeon]|nr:MAG: hypothetical protein AUJ65_05200 [Candidatus Micrarchaeota archaeon CG1_02_51_15]HII39355.1 ATP-binding protein [Candidatus Micrarchaeota archaeon]